MRSRLLAAAALAALATAAAAPPARADGDPASDYLLSQDVFLSFSEGAHASSSAERLVQTGDVLPSDPDASSPEHNRQRGLHLSPNC